MTGHAELAERIVGAVKAECPNWSSDFLRTEFRTRTSAVAPTRRMIRLVRTGPYRVWNPGTGLTPGVDAQYARVSASWRRLEMRIVCFSLPRMRIGTRAQTI